LLLIVSLALLITGIAAPYQGWWKYHVEADILSFSKMFGTLGQRTCHPIVGCTVTKYSSSNGAPFYPLIHTDGSWRKSLRFIGIAALISMILSAVLLILSFIVALLAYGGHKHGRSHHAGGLAIFAGVLGLIAASLMTGWHIGLWNQLVTLGVTLQVDYAQILVWIAGPLAVFAGILLIVAGGHRHHYHTIY